MTNKAEMRLVEAMDNEQLVGSLIALYHCQLPDEKLNKGTAHDNGMGFNSFDANIMTSMAEFYLEKGRLSEKQLHHIRRTIKKYQRQIDVMSPAPLEVKISKSRRKQESKKLISLLGEQIKIEFPFDRDLMDQVKSISGRRWNQAEKFWSCPLRDYNINDLLAMGFQMDQSLSYWYASKSDLANGVVEVSNEFERMYPFQKEGLAFIENHNGRGLIADEMGLGKTVQALSYLGLHKEKRPALIICPASLKLNWKKEITKWLPGESVSIISGSKAFDKADTYIINYDIVNKQLERLEALDLQVIIMDESHYVKNAKAARTKACRELTKGVPHVIGLSGTPITNRPIELFTILNILDPIEWNSYWKYAQTYCGAKHNGYGWDFNGSSNTKELHDRLTRSVMIRRLKENVLKDLPAKVRCVVPMELSNRTKYKQAETSIIQFIAANEGLDRAEKAKQAEVLVKIEKLKQLALEGKLKQAIKWIEDYLETNDKLVVFATHTATLDALEAAFSNTVRVDGSTSQANRQKAVDDFQEKPNINLFLGNIKAAGVGLTLTAANATCFLEFPWTSGDLDQAEDRVHRIGQKADSVMAYYLVGEDSIDEYIAELIDEKRKVLTQVLDGKDVEDNSLFTELLNKLKGE